MFIKDRFHQLWLQNVTNEILIHDQLNFVSTLRSTIFYAMIKVT